MLGHPRPCLSCSHFPSVALSIAVIQSNSHRHSKSFSPCLYPDVWRERKREMCRSNAASRSSMFSLINMFIKSGERRIDVEANATLLCGWWARTPRFSTPQVVRWFKVSSTVTVVWLNLGLIPTNPSMCKKGSTRQNSVTFDVFACQKELEKIWRDFRKYTEAIENTGKRLITDNLRHFATKKAPHAWDALCQW